MSQRFIAHGLDTILSEIEAGKFAFQRALGYIHMNAMAGPAEWASADGVKLVSAAIAGGPD